MLLSFSVSQKHTRSWQYLLENVSACLVWLGFCFCWEKFHFNKSQNACLYPIDPPASLTVTFKHFQIMSNKVNHFNDGTCIKNQKVILVSINLDIHLAWFACFHSSWCNFGIGRRKLLSALFTKHVFACMWWSLVNLFVVITKVCYCNTSQPPVSSLEQRTMRHMISIHEREK